MDTINSSDNKRIKEIAKLKKPGVRKERGVIVIDGAREIELAVLSGLEIINLFYCPDLTKISTGNFFGIDTDKIIEVSAAAFKKICYKDNPDGYFAIAKAAAKPLSGLKTKKNPLLVVLEAVEKPGNLGAIIRTAYAAGADAIIINDNQTDIYNPNVIRASEGLVFAQPIAVASASDTISWLKKNKIKSLAAATSARGIYTQEKMDGPLAIILGSEAFGLSENWLKEADKAVKIPMEKGIDSLNVSVSAAILLYEAVRQREK